MILWPRKEASGLRLFSLPHGVQVVLGSNPSAPTIFWPLFAATGTKLRRTADRPERKTGSGQSYTSWIENGGISAGALRPCMTFHSSADQTFLSARGLQIHGGTVPHSSEHHRLYLFQSLRCDRFAPDVDGWTGIRGSDDPPAILELNPSPIN